MGLLINIVIQWFHGSSGSSDYYAPDGAVNLLNYKLL